MRRRAGFTLIELLVVIAIIAILASLLLPGLARAKEQGRTARCISNVRQITMALSMYADDHVYYPPGRFAGSGPGAIRLWYQSLTPYLTKWTNGTTVFRCPSFKFRQANTIGVGPPTEYGVGSYGYNNNHPHGLAMFSLAPGIQPRFVKESDVRVPSKMLAIADSYLVERHPEKIMEGETDLQYIPDRFRRNWGGYKREQKETNARHAGRFNVGFIDGHVEKIRYSKLFADDPEARRIWNVDHEWHPTPYD